jgi:MSHA pilin protein MshC
MTNSERGFSLIELITVMILLGILSVVLFSRLGSTNTAAVQGSRDDIIAAFSLAQQTAMMRPNITLVVTANSISVNENSSPIAGSSYPLNMPNGVSLSPPATFSYDKLGRTTAGAITVSRSGVSAQIAIEASGYAYAN